MMCHVRSMPLRTQPHAEPQVSEEQRLIHLHLLSRIYTNIDSTNSIGTVTYQPPGAVDRKFFIEVSDLFDPGASKNASEKMQLRSFCRYFRADISHGEPDRARDNFQKNKKILWLFTKTRFQCFSNQSIFYKTPRPRVQMTNDRKWII